MNNTRGMGRRGTVCRLERFGSVVIVLVRVRVGNRFVLPRGHHWKSLRLTVCDKDFVSQVPRPP